MRGELLYEGGLSAASSMPRGAFEERSLLAGDRRFLEECPDRSAFDRLFSEEVSAPHQGPRRDTASREGSNACAERSCGARIMESSREDELEFLRMTRAFPREPSFDRKELRGPETK